MIKTYHFQFEELSVSCDEVLDFMGFEEGLAPEPFPEIIQQGMDEAPQFCQISGGIQIFDSVKVHTEKQSIQINNQTFFPAKVVTTQLRNATSAALFLCTAGEAISKKAQQLTSEGETLQGYVFDVIGSITVDKAMDKIELELQKELADTGMLISDRYSPGYCNWNITDQEKIFALFPAGFCDISLTHSMLMNPIKSVSGIIGIGQKMKKVGYQCRRCNDSNCIYGNIKRKKT